MSNAFVEATLAAAIRDVDRALDLNMDDRERQRHTLLAYERLQAIQQMLEVERTILSAAERATRYARGLRPLRLVES